MREAFFAAADTGKALRKVIPGSNVLIANGPVDGNTFLGVGLKIIIAPAIALTAPHQAAPSDMIAPEPVKTFCFGVGTLTIFYPIVQVGLVQKKNTFQDGIVLLHLLGGLATVRIIPCFFIRIDIVFYMLDIPSPLQHDHL